MLTFFLISITAMLVGIVGCVAIWGLDASRANEVERRASDIPTPRPALPGSTPSHPHTP